MAPRLEDTLAAKLHSRDEKSSRRRLILPNTTVDLSSNDYLSLSTNHDLRDHFLGKLKSAELVLGSGGSRLLDGNTPAHVRLENRLKDFFRSSAALLFNSGFEANASFFSCVPQPGDIIVYDEYIHASVHDGMRASRARQSLSFRHNTVSSLRDILSRLIKEVPLLKAGRHNVFIAVESLYSMDGDFAPLVDILDIVEGLLPLGNGYVVVDEAHATGVYGPQGRGIVSSLGVEDRVFSRLVTFGKALGASGAFLAVFLVSPILREYLINYARPLIYTTAMSHTTVLSIGCSLDFLENGTASKLSSHLHKIISHFLDTIRPQLHATPHSIVALPSCLMDEHALDRTRLSPIIPLLTPQPRPLAAHLQSLGYLVRPIVHPTVPKGQERVRVCLHAGNTLEEVHGFIEATMGWVHAQTAIEKGRCAIGAKL
ncbi:hypothetical protein BOTBODRAFT_533261 [Botryobasidium botryosum FD-172 SS1]|uniref:Aminotransferase class I/classII large domain-containing protein n=1 Tax=Botryobasidium botryosum (strain FD-172 SS1) TaxID=930990 RepID=A0A067MBA3_BOTB1|nr:hypothetical protein BOTBODRAFT_533261 [Botryobasidium botryosum FD-172 SS1]